MIPTVWRMKKRKGKVWGQHLTHKHRQTFMQQGQCLNGYPPTSVVAVVAAAAAGPVYHHKTHPVMNNNL